MNTHGTTVFLDMPVSGIAQRLLHAKRKRPLVEGKNQEELIDFIADRLPARKQYYNKAQIKIDALNFNVEKLAAQIMSKIT